MKKLIGPHLAGTWIDKLELLRKWQPPFILVLQPKTEEVKRLREACPNAVIVGRFYHDDNFYAENIKNRPIEFAKEIHNEIMSSGSLPYLDYVQSNNETNQDYAGLAKLNQFTMEWMKLADTANKYKCAILAFSVGNPDLPYKPGDPTGFDGRMILWLQVIESLRYAQKNHHLLLLHAYGFPSMFQPDANWYIYRYERQVAKNLQQLGITGLAYAYGEIGIDKLITNIKGGYKSVTTPDDYVNQLFQWERDLQGEKNLLGGAIFTFGDSGGWRDYDISDTPVAVTIATRYSNNASLYDNTAPTLDVKPIEPLVQKEETNAVIDERLKQRGVVFKFHTPKAGEGYWKLIKAEYLDEKEHIFVNTLDEYGKVKSGVPVTIYWSSGFDTFNTEDKSNDPYALGMMNFLMKGHSQSYGIRFNEPHDEVWGEGLGSPEQPNWNIHRSGRYTFQWTIPSQEQEKPEPIKTYLPMVPNANGSPGVTTAILLNVRNQPSLEGEIVAQLPMGTKIFISESKNGFAKIGTGAWVSEDYVQRTDQPPTPPPSRQTITTEDFKRYLAMVMGIDLKLVDAVFRAESGNRFYNEQGKVIIRTELHLLKNYLTDEQFHRHFRILGPRAWEGHEYRETPSSSWKKFHGGETGGGQLAEYKVHEIAKGLHRVGAFMSMSMGAAQILGSNYKTVGYASAEEMYNDFAQSEAAQVAAFYAFISNTEALPALKRGDLERFIEIYNGPGQVPYYLNIIKQYMK